MVVHVNIKRAVRKCRNKYIDRVLLATRSQQYWKYIRRISAILVHSHRVLLVQYFQTYSSECEEKRKTGETCLGVATTQKHETHPRQ